MPMFQSTPGVHWCCINWNLVSFHLNNSALSFEPKNDFYLNQSLYAASIELWCIFIRTVVHFHLTPKSTFIVNICPIFKVEKNKNKNNYKSR